MASTQDKDSLIAWDSLMDFQGAQRQKEGQEDQGTLKALGGSPGLFYLSLVLLAILLALPWPPQDSIKLA